MHSVTIEIRKRRYRILVTAVASLLDEYGVSGPPGDGFDVETLDTVTDFEEFEIVRDFGVRLGEARPSDSAYDGDSVELAVHAHHLVALVAAFPDLVGASDVPEAEFATIVQGLCHAYLAELTGTSRDG